ncbi:glycosyltransferase [Duganella sp. CT11-25]|jgi:glycosyltransferase involved in cell wall biosynthesis|uniref:glycosyltransferase n=1 Tax=unclassified Duganella TaxID=2636909 RepID=UPI0039AF99B7
MSFPLVSIVIPSYKPAHFEMCLRSAIGQTYPNTEILVSDNCPTEEIHEICKRFPGVIYQRSTALREQNVISAFYSGKGEFIKPLYDDDLLHPFCVERMVAAFQSAPDIQLVFSASQVIDISNMRVETRRPYQASGHMSGLDMHRHMAMNLTNHIGELATVMFRRARLWELGWHQLFKRGSHDFTKGLADIASYINFTENGALFYVDEELSYFRHDQRLQSNSNAHSNPHFGYNFSDYIDLAVSAHETGAITSDELLAMHEVLVSVNQRLGGVFPQMGEAFERYTAYRGKLL